MNLYLVLDESGNLHRNSPTRYFIIGGYLTSDTHKVRSVFKKTISQYKKIRHIEAEEVKGSAVKDIDKTILLSEMYFKIIKSNIFIPVLIAIDKNNLKKKIKEVNILYNYFIKILLENLIKWELITSSDILRIKLDNKSIKVGSANSLIEYLKGEFFFSGLNLESIDYLDSSKKYEIQMADFICNHYWRFFEKNSGIRAKKECYKRYIVYFPYDNFGKK